MRPIIAAIALLALAPFTAAAQEELHGRVVDAYTGEPLAGVAVNSSSARAESGRDGRFSIACAGPMTLAFRRVSYRPVTREVATCSTVLEVTMVPASTVLDPISVTSSRETFDPDVPRSVTVLDGPELHRGTGLFLEEALNLTPGLRMEKRTMSGGQRITIRGYGQASNFNGSGYKAYLNGIPITDAEGVTILDDVDFATIGRVEVIRGPASSRFGTGIGGVINLYTVRPERQGTTAMQDVLSGADGLLRTNTRIASAGDNSSLLINYGHQDYDSYRIHSGSTKDHVVLVGDFRPAEDRSVSTFLAYAHSYDQRAGQLDSAQFFGKENTGESRYLNNDAHSDIESFRAGVTYGHRLTDRITTALTGFYAGGTGDDAFAVGLTMRSTQNFGARASVETRLGTDRTPVTGATGIEYQKTNGFTKGYALTDLELGAMRSDLETHTSQASVFTNWEVGLPALVTMTAGASVNFIAYDIDDRLANSANPTHLDAGGHKSFDPVVTPSLALRRPFGPDVSAYVRFSEGYSPPTTADAVIPYTGEANDGLEPERATLVEAGVKGTVLDRRLAFEVVLFDMRVTDKLTTQGVFEGGTQLYRYTVNAGDQTNRGAEVSATYALLGRSDALVSLVRPFVTYTYSRFRYDDFRSNANDDESTIDYSGNRVVGVPPSLLSTGVDVGFRGGAYAHATYQYVDAMPLTYDNAHEAPSFSLVNAKAGVSRDLGARLHLDVFAGGMNLTNSLHYTMVFLNGNYGGANPPAIYLPGPYRAKFFGGASVAYRF